MLAVDTPLIPEAIANGAYAASARVAVSGSMDNAGHATHLTLELFAQIRGRHPLHDNVFVLHPKLAGRIVAGWMQRCALLGPQGVQDFADQLARGNQVLKQIIAQLQDKDTP